MLQIKPGEHGSTYGGNPIACRVAMAALQVGGQNKYLCFQGWIHNIKIATLSIQQSMDESMANCIRPLWKAFLKSLVS